MGDWNETCQGNSTSYKLCRAIGLVDVWKLHHPETEFNSYLRGSRRIDFVLAPREIAQKMNIIYEPFKQRGDGDHRGLCIDIAETDLLGHTCPPLYHHPSRGFHSKDKKATRKYIETLDLYLLTHNVYDRAYKIYKSDTPDHISAESLDQAITRGCIAAEHQCNSRRRSEWTPKIHHLRQQLSI